jgi:hypothetical protein
VQSKTILRQSRAIEESQKSQRFIKEANRSKRRKNKKIIIMITIMIMDGIEEEENIKQRWSVGG